ncbi:unnamed protein product [Schistosoma margrebowiei]|uniref:Uncharacterized protein n=1 Tax=Schistosoma margrebowiei TaxID=48269 RepID=A0AA85AQ18_9TREM|nr:unnamed protein product [Schistosoma margrebowiei]
MTYDKTRLKFNSNISYYNHNKQFDLPSLLATGKFYIDEYGFLVTSNGTRYRIPSGPPEGRKPLQFNQLPIINNKNKSIIHFNYPINIINKSHETIHIELQDTHKLINNSDHDYDEHDHNSIMQSSSSSSSSTSSSSSLLLSLPYMKSNLSMKPLNNSSSMNFIHSNQHHHDHHPSDTLHTIDWNVILFTLIISSISLVCNIILIVFLSYRLHHHHPRHHPHVRHYQKWLHHHHHHHKHFNSSCNHSNHENKQLTTTSTTNNTTNYEYKDILCNHLFKNQSIPCQCITDLSPVTNCPCVYKQMKDNKHTRNTTTHKDNNISNIMNSNIKNLSYPCCNINSNCDLHSSLLRNHKKSKKIKSSIIKQSNQYNEHDHLYSCNKSLPFNHHWLLCSTNQQSDIDPFNNNNDWKIIPNHDMISDCSNEDAYDNKNNNSSKQHHHHHSNNYSSNSNILYTPSKYSKQRQQQHKCVHLQTNTNQRHHISQQPISIIHSYNTLLNQSPRLNDCVNDPTTEEDEELQQQGIEQEDDHDEEEDEEQEQEEQQREEDNEHLVTNPKCIILKNSIFIYHQYIYICYTIAIHLGILGIILSLLQLLVICIALIQKTTLDTTYYITYNHEFICLLSNSLATDTLLCVRLYLVTIFILCSFIIFYIQIIMKMVITIIDFTSFQLPKYSFYKRFLFTIIHNTTNKHTTYNHDSNHIYFQQNFAYIALIHSIPWALAAGTSLFIAFLYQTPIHSNSLIINKSISNHSHYTWIESIKLNHVNLLFNGLHSLLTCSMKRTSLSTLSSSSISSSSSSSSSPLTTSTPMNHDVITTTTSTWMSSILLIIIPLLLQMIMIILFIILLYMIISYINHRNCIIYKLKLPNQSIILIILILLIELISLCIPIVYHFIMTLYSINDKQLLFITRIIILHFCIDPILLIYIIQKCLSNKYILMLSNKFNIIHMKSIKNKKINKNQLIDYHSLECINNDNNVMKPLTSPIHLFNCLPMHHSNTITSTTTYTTTNTTYNSNNNIQSVVMPYLTDSGYFVSTINNNNSNNNNSLITSSIINNDKINMNNYILPITTDTIEVTMPNIYPNNNNSITSSSNNIHQKDSSLLTPVTEMMDHNTLIYKNMYDAYPQLCQHHQRLLAEQYKQPNMDTIKRNRHFTNVPRMNQMITTTTTNFNALSINKSINECSNKQSIQIINNHNHNDTIPHIMNEMVCTQQHSTATAAVMAAAAAAVAAQASTLTKPIHSLLDSIQMTPNPLLFINEQKTIEQPISNDNQ